MSETAMSGIDPRLFETRQAFDSVAAEYDGPLGNNVLIRRMRRALWRAVEDSFPPGARLLDLGCGTGLDAVRFAARGDRVVAIDWSPEMVERARQRVEQHDLSRRVSTRVVGIHQLHRLADENPGQFDGIYSNLGPLNCVPDLPSVAGACARLLRPGGRLIASVIGRWCPWEILYYATRRNAPRALLRATSGPVPVALNGHRVWTRYFTPREFYREFATRFELARYRGLGIAMPPPYLIQAYGRFRPLFTPLGWLDDWIGAIPLLRDVGDHFLIEMTGRVSDE